MGRTPTDLLALLSDHSFEYIGECLEELCSMIERETSRKPSLNDLCQLLAISLQTCPDGMLDDIDPDAVESLTPNVREQKRLSMNPGDVFAVPLHSGGFAFIVYLTSNRFGDAFGVLDGRSVPPITPSPLRPSASSDFFYTGRTLVKNGHWRKVDHRPDLLRAFPASPEIFHSNDGDDEDELIGPFGSGETAEGVLRELTEAEAHSLGLIKGQYKQVLAEQEAEAFIVRATEKSVDGP